MAVEHQVRRLPRQPGHRADRKQLLVQRDARVGALMDLSEARLGASVGGRLLWVREVPTGTSLTASAGGVFYTALDRPERKESSPSDDLLIEGFEAATGTKLWSSGIPSHNRPFEGEWSITQLSYGAPGGPGWRIGPDGAIYGITLKGAYRLY